ITWTRRASRIVKEPVLAFFARQELFLHASFGWLYNQAFGRFSMNTRFALIGLLAVAGLVWADEVDESYTALQEAVNKKDVAAVQKLGPETAKLGAALAAAPQPADASQVDNWKQRAEFGKQVATYAEYALASTAIGAEPAQTVDLVDSLINVNPK